MNIVSIKDFVLSFVRGASPAEAAITAGVEPERARSHGLRLLSKPAVRRQIAKEREAALETGSGVRAGLERLAFGRDNDAAALVFAEEVSPEMLAKADLYNVSEIKRVKGGGVEVKFFDRQKALERLAELDQAEFGDKKVKDLVELVYGSELPDGGDADE